MANRIFDRQTSVVRDLERNATEVTNYYVFHAEPTTPRRSLWQLVLETVIWFTIVTSLLTRLFG